MEKELSMSLRTRRAMGLLAAVAIFASACGIAASPTPAPSQDVSAAPSATSAEATSADFRFAIDGEPTYFSPSSNDQPTSWVNRLIYTGLYRVNNKGDVVPDLATAMPAVSADGMTLTIKMRTDATWHDGSPVTSADAKFTFDLAMSPKCSFNPTTCSTWGDNVGSVGAPSPDTLVITMKNKYAPIYILGLTQGLVPKAATEASYAKFVAGSGPVDAAAVKALAGRISTAQGDAACAGATPPDTCNASFYRVDMEAVLTSAGVTLPDQARFVGEDGKTDTAAYSDDVRGQLTDLNTTLQAGETDKLAAAYRLLDINLNPVGTGAYKFVRYTPGQSVELARFDDYYLFKPGPAKVLVLVIKDAAAAAEALLSGKIDWQPEITSSDALAALKANPKIKLSEYDDLSYVYIGFNVRPGHVFSDVVARRAFAMCIDHAATVQAAAEGNAVPVNGNVPPGSYFYDPSIPDYRLDVAGARTLLESNGYTLRDGVYEKDGKKLRADLYVRQDRPQVVQFAQLVKGQVAKCGIDITVKESDDATVLVPLLYYPNNFDIYLGGWGDLTDAEDSTFFGCKHVTTKDDPHDNNFTGYCDPKLDELQKAAAQELDRAKRKEILARVQLYLHDNGPYYFVWADLGHKGYSANVTTNGELGPIDHTSFYDWWNLDSWIVKP
jgi:ABC-type transport system substrate-binding protein